MGVRSRGVVGALAALAALCLAACGGDDGDEGAATTGGGQDASSYIAAADEICARADEEAVAAIGEQFPGLTPESATPKQLERIAREILVPSLKRQLKELRALEMPEPDTDELNAIYAKLEAGIGEVLDDPELVIAGTTPSLQEASELAADYGFQACGQ